MVTYIIIGIIALYSAFVIYKKIKDVKNGKFCNCGCDGCSSSKKCHPSKSDER